jgi:signal transduction histidine kinase
VTGPSGTDATPPMAPEDELAAARSERFGDLQRSEGIMTRVRYAAVGFAVLQTMLYVPPAGIPMPDYVRPGGLVIAALFALGTTIVWLISRRAESLEAARALALASLAMDIAIASGFVWFFSFDPESAQWAILFVLPLEGAVRFQLRGALWTWAAVTVLYIGRELFAAQRYGFEVAPESISFRMGLNLLIALVAGSMASDLVSQRAKVEDSLHQLARIDVLRRHLVSTLAHDVRGPLTTIRGAVTTLLERPGLSAEHRGRLLEAADRQAGRLQYLAADLLDLARLEQGRLELDIQPVRLRDAVRSASSYADSESQYELDIDPDLHVLADPHRLEQVVVNLATNALRYGRPPYRIVASRRGDRVSVAFCDQGAGVPAEKRDQLFQPFSASDEATGSVGLGLWVCRMLLEAQAGELSYRFDPEAGSVFEFVLDPADGPQAESESQAASGRAQAP